MVKKIIARTGLAVAVMAVALLLGCGSPAADSDELKLESQQLFDAFAKATSDGDMGALYELLAPDITGRCTAEHLEGTLGSEGSGFGFGILKVTEVFLSVDDADRAYVRVALPEDAESSLGIGLTAFPLPIVRDQGRWLLSFPYLPGGDGCPFESDTVSQSATPAPPWAGLPDPIALGLDSTALTAPPGTKSQGSGWGGGEGQFEASILLETEATASDLLQHYRSELEQPYWTFQSEYQGADAAWTTWSIRDDSDRLWMAVLFAGKAEEGLRRVRFWAVTGASVDVLRGLNLEGVQQPEPAAAPVPGP